MIVQLSKEYLLENLRKGMASAERESELSVAISENGSVIRCNNAIVIDKEHNQFSNSYIDEFAKLCSFYASKSDDDDDDDDYIRDCSPSHYSNKINNAIARSWLSGSRYTLIVYDEERSCIFGYDESECIDKLVSMCIEGKSIYEIPYADLGNLKLYEKSYDITAWPADTIKYFDGTSKYFISKNCLADVVNYIINNMSDSNPWRDQAVRETCGNWMINNFGFFNLSASETVKHYEMRRCLNNGYTSFKTLPEACNGWPKYDTEDEDDYDKSIDVCILSFTCQLAHNTYKEGCDPKSYILLSNIFFSIDDYIIPGLIDDGDEEED